MVPLDNILFASEMLGAVKGIDPDTGRCFDDTKRYVDEIAWLGPADKQKLFEGNALRVYPRLAAPSAAGPADAVPTRSPTGFRPATRSSAPDRRC